MFVCFGLLYCISVGFGRDRCDGIGRMGSGVWGLGLVADFFMCFSLHRIRKPGSWRRSGLVSINFLLSPPPIDDLYFLLLDLLIAGDSFAIETQARRTEHDHPGEQENHTLKPKGKARQGRMFGGRHYFSSLHDMLCVCHCQCHCPLPHLINSSRRLSLYAVKAVTWQMTHHLREISIAVPDHHRLSVYGITLSLKAWIF